MRFPSQSCSRSVIESSVWAPGSWEAKILGHPPPAFYQNWVGCHFQINTRTMMCTRVYIFFAGFELNKGKDERGW